jgi:opacity protein-like surface antigen
LFAQNALNEVSLNWPAVEGASGYQLEFKDSVGSAASKQQFNTTVASWKGNLRPGRYNFRLRSLDEVGAPGPWSGKVPLTVKLPPVTPSFPKSKSQFKSKGTADKEIQFKWQPIVGAKEYKLAVLDNEGEVVFETKSKVPSATAKLPLANQYKWKVLAISPEGDEGSALEELPNFELQGGRLGTPKLNKIDLVKSREITWEAPSKAEIYDVKILHRKKGKKKYRQIYASKKKKDESVEFKDNWPVGSYKIRVRAKAKKFASSKYSSKRFKFNGTNTSEGKFSSGYLDRSGYLAAIEFAPFRRNFSIASDQVNIEVNQAVINSWRMHLGYQNTSPSNEFGVGMFGQVTSGTLFESDEQETNQTGQQPLDTNSTDYGINAWDNYMVTGGIGGHASLEVVRRSVFSIYAQDFSTLAIQRSEIVEPILNLGLLVRFSANASTLAKIGYGVPFLVQDDQETESFGHILAAFGFDYWLTRNLVTRYGYDYSRFSFIAAPPNGTDALQFSSANHTVSFNVGYLF